MLDKTREQWPPDYNAEFVIRQKRLLRLRRNPTEWPAAREFYRTRPLTFIHHWVVTYDPRNAGGDVPATIPLIPFELQRRLIRFIHFCLIHKRSGLVEKSRDMGATWICCAISVWLFLFWPGASIGWGSRVAKLVDNLGNPDSIFEKMRMIIRALPRELLPVGFSPTDHMNIMRFINPETHATIVGEGGDDVGRGGRSSIYFKDESAHYEHPESIEASLSENAPVQIDISSVNGLGNVFHRRRESGVEWVEGMELPPPGRALVLVMDWREHPAKDQVWYEQIRDKLVGEGLAHILAQEVDRNYSAAVQGVVIPAEWVRSAIDAHKTLNLKGDGGWVSALDVADEGGDTNAQASRKGIVLRSLDEWGERDTGRTARRAIVNASSLVPVQIQYDCIGVGTGVKSEINRLDDEGDMPRGLRFVPWNAGDTPQDADRRVIERDKDSPLWSDFVQNLKAQGWWLLRRRFEVTHRAVTEKRDGQKVTPFDEDELISLDSTLPLLWKLVKELSQPTMTRSSRLKLMIDKRGEGVKSPNLADAVMMVYHPMKVAAPLVVGAGVLANARIPSVSKFGRSGRRR